MRHSAVGDGLYQETAHFVWIGSLASVFETGGFHLLLADT